MPGTPRPTITRSAPARRVGVVGETEEERMDEIRTAEDMERASTYASTMMLTQNRGLVIRMANGAEFQITIVQSRRPAKVAVGE